MIKIELLDYKYDNFSNNQVSFGLATSTSDWTILNDSAASITTGSGNRFITPVTGNLTEIGRASCRERV